MNTLLRPSAALIAMVVLAGSLFFSLPDPASAANATVAVGDFFFCGSQFQGSACTTIVNVGDTVTWEFSGASTHTTMSASGGWDSGNVSPGGTFQHTFTAAGSFNYVCNIHPMLMLGTIVVQAPPATSTPPPSDGTPVVSSTPVAGATPTPGSALPPTGQGPQSRSANGWLLAALAISGLGFVATGAALSRRAR